MTDRAAAVARGALQREQAERHREAPAPGPAVGVGMLGIDEGLVERADLGGRERTAQRALEQLAIPRDRAVVGRDPAVAEHRSA